MTRGAAWNYPHMFGHFGANYTQLPNGVPATGQTFTGVPGPRDANGNPTLSGEQQSMLFFGLPQSHAPQDPFSNYPVADRTLPFSWRDAATKINKVLIREITAEQTFFTGIAPLKPFNGTRVTITELKFDDHTLIDMPEKGAPVMTTHRFQSQTKYLKRKGRGFQMEKTFAMTPEGMQFYAYNIKQISHAVWNYLAISFFYAMLNACPQPANFYEVFGIPSNKRTLVRLFEKECSLWGILQKRKHGFIQMEQMGKDVFNIRGIQMKPNALIIPSGTFKYLSLNRPEAFEHSETGGNPAKDIGTLNNVARFGDTEYHQAIYYPVEQELTEDPLNRERMCGELYLMDDIGKHLPPAQYTSANRQVTILDCEYDKKHDIGFLDALRHTGLFKDDGSLSDEIGKRFFFRWANPEQYFKHVNLDYTRFITYAHAKKAAAAPLPVARPAAKAFELRDQGAPPDAAHTGEEALLGLYRASLPRRAALEQFTDALVVFDTALLALADDGDQLNGIYKRDEAKFADFGTAAVSFRTAVENGITNGVSLADDYAVFKAGFNTPKKRQDIFGPLIAQQPLISQCSDPTIIQQLHQFWDLVGPYATAFMRNPALKITATVDNVEATLFIREGRQVRVRTAGRGEGSDEPTSAMTDIPAAYYNDWVITGLNNDSLADMVDNYLNKNTRGGEGAIAQMLAEVAGHAPESDDTKKLLRSIEDGSKNPVPASEVKRVLNEGIKQSLLLRLRLNTILGRKVFDTTGSFNFGGRFASPAARRTGGGLDHRLAPLAATHDGTGLKGDRTWDQKHFREAFEWEKNQYPYLSLFATGFATNLLANAEAAHGTLTANVSVQAAIRRLTTEKKKLKILNSLFQYTDFLEKDRVTERSAEAKDFIQAAHLVAGMLVRAAGQALYDLRTSLVNDGGGEVGEALKDYMDAVNAANEAGAKVETKYAEVRAIATAIGTKAAGAVGPAAPAAADYRNVETILASGVADLSGMSWNDFTFGLMQSFYDNHWPIPINILLARPHASWEMGSAILTIKGPGTAGTYFGKADLEISGDGVRKMRMANFTCYCGVVVEEPSNVAVLHNISCNDYCGGAGVVFWDPLNEDDRINYSNNELTKDIFALAVPYNYVQRSGWVDLTGGLPSALLKRSDPGADDFDYPTSELYGRIWGWRSRVTNYMQAGYYQQDFAGGGKNTRCAMESYLTPKGTTAQQSGDMHGRHVAGNGHWGSMPIYDGMRRDRCGEGHGYVQDFTIQYT